jgi:hypothetical protein
MSNRSSNLQARVLRQSLMIFVVYDDVALFICHWAASVIESCACRMDLSRISCLRMSRTMSRPDLELSKIDPRCYRVHQFAK